MDVTIHNALLDKTHELVNIGIENGQIIKITTDALSSGEQSINAKGRLVIPPFFESHFHLDNSLIWGDYKTHDLSEAIEAFSRAKFDMDTPDIVRRSTETLRMCLANGVFWLRSHVDIEHDAKLKLLEGVKAVRDLFAGILDIQIVLFPQNGMARDPEAVELMYAAMENGADIVGGIPHFECDMDDAARQIEIAFEIAKKYDADIDMHVDQKDDPYWQSLELLAEKTIGEKYHGRVNAGYCCSMAAWDEKTFQRILPKVKEAQLTITTNGLTNLIKQGRADPPPVRRGIPRLADLITAGINVTCAIDDMKNMFYPFGTMNPLDVVHIAAHAGYLTTKDLQRSAFEMPLYNAARLFQVEDHGIMEGNTANLVILPVNSIVDTIRFHPSPALVMREDRALIQTEVQREIDPSIPK
jgi:cytosine deaminase